MATLAELRAGRPPELDPIASVPSPDGALRQQSQTIERRQRTKIIEAQRSRRECPILFYFSFFAPGGISIETDWLL